MCLSSSYAKQKTRLFILCTLVVQGLLYGGSVKTINVTRTFSDWRVAGCNCNDQEKQYWYVFHKKMMPHLKQQLRLCGGSVLYIGERNQCHLYYQAISVSCDSILSFLKQDSNFINIFPHIAEEKLSHNIYSGSNLFYIDSTDSIIKAQVIFNINPTEQMVIILGTCVDSVQRSSNNVFVFGTREEMLCVAQKPYVKNVFDIEKPKPPTMEEARRQTGVDTLHKQYLDLSTVPPDTGWNSGRPYTGKEVTVAICEVGTPDSTNLDFNETMDGTLNNLKLRQVASSGSWSNAVLHKTHVAGIVAGSGWMGCEFCTQCSFNYRLGQLL